MASARSTIVFLAILHLWIVCVVADFQSDSSENQIAMNNLCPKGFHMFNSTATPVVCHPCPDGTFAHKPNTDPKCRRCQTCDERRYKFVKRKCTSTHDTKCECFRGRFWNKGLSFCYPCDECGRGEGVTRQCDGRNNTKCEPCKEGHTFSNNSSLTDKCRPCSKCEKGHVVEKHCTKQNDTVCRPAKSNESERPNSQHTSTVGRHTLRSTTESTTEITATEGNSNSVGTENGGDTTANLDVNLIIAGVAGFVLVVVVVAAVLVLRKKFGRSTDSCQRGQGASPSTPDQSSTSISVNDDTESKHRIMVPPYGPEKYLRDISFSLISDLSCHLNPEGRWKILAGRLGFTTNEISNINIKPEEATETMLNRWGQRHESTVNHLFEVLMSLGWKHEAGLIRKYIYLP